MKRYLLCQQYDYDVYSNTYLEFDTLEKLLNHEIEESNHLHMTDPINFVPFNEYKKNVKFISWDYANRHMNNKYDNFVYTFKKQLDIGINKNDNGDWEYIPILSCYDNGERLNIWAEIDYSQKILI